MKAEERKIIDELGKEKALEMYRTLLEIREFEEQVRYLFLEGKMPGTVHQYIGQEACAVGVCSALEDGDVIASTHRPHGHAIARGIPIKAIASELYGRSTGCCNGKGGSMHVGDLSRGMLPAIAIVGANIPVTAGMALAFKLRGEKRVAVSFFGDGATNEGAFHEGVNAATVYQLPALFVCENNLYGASTPLSKVMKLENIADRGAGYGIASSIADGMDVLAVFSKTRELLHKARSGEGPSLLELKTFRLCGHSRRDPCNYMSEEEKQYWQEHDPIPTFENKLLEAGLLTPEVKQTMQEETESQVKEALSDAQSAPFPDAEDTFRGLYTSMEVPR
jgi:pyruvate dehydrogenase E1 component alpha subunit